MRPSRGNRVRVFSLPLLAAFLVPLPWVAQAEETPPAVLPGDGPVVSGPLKLLVGELPLPFKYRVRTNDISVSAGAALTVRQEVHLVPEEGPRAGKPLEVDVSYIRLGPDRTSFVQDAIRIVTERFAGDERTRALQPFQAEGFGFTAADAWDKVNGDEERVLRLMGHLDGALINVFIADAQEGDGVSDLFEGLLRFKPDYAATLRFPKRLEAETARTVRDGRMLTVIGAIANPKKVEPAVTSTGATFDGNGRVVRSSQNFLLKKRGQRAGLLVACGLTLPEDEERRAKLANPLDPEDKDVSIVSKGAARLGDRPAQRLVSDTKVYDGYHLFGTRWFAEIDPGYALVDISHSNGRLQQLHVEEQLAGLTVKCDPQTVVHLDPPADTGEATEAVPAASAAPAAQD